MTTLPSLPAQLAQALADKGYDALTPVQAAMLDPDLAGRDLLVSAQTGSGKTVAFGLAMAGQLVREGEFMAPPDTPQALVIAPTRELALQVTREFEWLYKPAGAVIASCVGGMDARTERRALDRGAHIVVGTPGRLRDHVERKSLDLSTLRTVVLDEADEMLDLGFREDLEFLLKACPEDRRTLMFSATVPRAIADLAQTYQRDAARVATEAPREAHVDISYRALTVAAEDAENAIVNVLRYYEARNTLVFCKTRAAVNHLTARFLNRGMAVVPLSGELAQEERSRALQAMRDGRARVCVATDVAARGIDLPGLELVIHADLPTNRETLLHRSGRTGRAGNKGVSVLIVPMSARRKAERLIQLAGVDAEWAAAPSAAEVSARDTERLLTDSTLGGAEKPDETGIITLLTERFTARELAAAVTRFYFAAHTAPEDIAAISPDGPKPRARTEFDRSFWVRVGAGHKDRAEPRWLLPMLCRVGNLTKVDIGAIRIFEDHTLAQLHQDCADRFFGALGETMALEQGITVARAEAPADADSPAPRRAPPVRGDSDRPMKPRAPRADSTGERPFKPRAPREEGESSYKPRAPRAEDTDRPAAPRAAAAASERPYTPRPPREDGERAYKPRATRPEAASKPYAARTESAPRPYTPRPPRGDEAIERPFKPRAPRPETGDTPYKPRAPRPDGERPYKARPAQSADAGERPFKARAPREDGERPYKPRAAGSETGERTFKPRTTEPGERPFKPRTPKPAQTGAAEAKPARPRLSADAARNPSARMDGKPARKPAGKPTGKPGGKPFAKPGKPRPQSGDQRPTRPKR